MLYYLSPRGTLGHAFICYNGPLSVLRKVDYHSKRVNQDGDYCDFQDGTIYDTVMKEDPDFRSDPRHLLLGFVTDGVQPFAGNNKYSMWPMLVTFYNFPPNIRWAS